MPPHAQLAGNAAVIDELFPKNPPSMVFDEVADKLESRLTSTFEAALNEGMSAAAALALVSSWLSGELLRLRSH